MEKYNNESLRIGDVFKKEKEVYSNGILPSSKLVLLKFDFLCLIFEQCYEGSEPFNSKMSIFELNDSIEEGEMKIKKEGEGVHYVEYMDKINFYQSLLNDEYKDLINPSKDRVRKTISSNLYFPPYFLEKYIAHKLVELDLEIVKKHSNEEFHELIKELCIEIVHMFEVGADLKEREELKIKDLMENSHSHPMFRK